MSRSNAAMHAAEKGLIAAVDDLGVQEVVWLLVRLPSAARESNFAEALRGIGIDAGPFPNLLDIAIGFQAAIDSRLKQRTDLAELAILAAIETIHSTVGEGARSLFGSGPEEVQQAIAALATRSRFGSFMRQFLSSFSFRCLIMS